MREEDVKWPSPTNGYTKSMQTANKQTFHKNNEKKKQGDHMTKKAFACPLFERHLSLLCKTPATKYS